VAAPIAMLPALVTYGGRGRRPGWCSSRCRSTAAVTLSELILAVDWLSAGLETGPIYNRDFVTLGPALERPGAA